MPHYRATYRHTQVILGANVTLLKGIEYEADDSGQAARMAQGVAFAFTTDGASVELASIKEILPF